jgi:L-aspartate oxidase
MKHFPMIYKHCKNVGIDISKDWIPVVPAQHYLCGGIVVDRNGKTSIHNLFACGECSQTGLHGANRLASNSLLEALVYSDKIYEYLAHQPINEINPKTTVSDWERIEKPMIDPIYISEFKSKLQLLMRQNAGIVRNDTDLLKAKEQLSKWQIEIDEICKDQQITKAIYELKNMIAIGTLIVKQSIERNENRGGFVKINT